MGKYIDVEESYDQERGTVRLYLVEEDGFVSGIYWDEDFAVQNARWTASGGESDLVVVNEVHFRRDEAEVVYVAKGANKMASPEPLNGDEQFSSASLDNLDAAPRSGS